MCIRDRNVDADLGSVHVDTGHLSSSLVAADGVHVLAVTGLDVYKRQEKLHVDPAVMASPLITTIVDATTLLIYFNVAKIVLHL